MTSVEEELAAVTRKAIEIHDEWDALHSLLIIHRDGAGVRVNTVVAIDPAFQPELYPLMIESIVKESAAKDGPPYALLLQIEAFGALMPEDDAPAWKKAEMEAHRVNRTLHQHPDAVEAAWAYTADVHGRVWTAMNARGHEEIEEHVYEPGSGKIGGHMLKALLDTLRMYGSEYARDSN